MSFDQFPDEIIQHLLLFLPPEDNLSIFRLLARRMTLFATVAFPVSLLSIDDSGGGIAVYIAYALEIRAMSNTGGRKTRSDHQDIRLLPSFSILVNAAPSNPCQRMVAKNKKREQGEHEPPPIPRRPSRNLPFADPCPPSQPKEKKVKKKGSNV